MFCLGSHYFKKDLSTISWSAPPLLSLLENIEIIPHHNIIQRYNNQVVGIVLLSLNYVFNQVSKPLFWDGWS